MDRTKDLRGSRSLLFISFKKGHTSDIRPTKDLPGSRYSFTFKMLQVRSFLFLVIKVICIKDLLQLIILFSLYTNPISSIIQSHSSIKYHFYADDTQLYISLSPAIFSYSVQKLKNCLNNIQNFMFTNKLQANLQCAVPHSLGKYF